MSIKVRTTCDMCGKTKNGYMSEVSIYGNNQTTKWNCVIPDIYLCEKCLGKFAKSCGIDLDKLQKEQESRKSINLKNL